MFNRIHGRLVQSCFEANGLNALAQHTWAHREKSEEIACGISQEGFQLLTEISEILLEQKQGKYHVVIGGMNTRLHEQLPQEDPILGPHIVGRGAGFLKKSCHNQTKKADSCLLHH